MRYFLILVCFVVSAVSGEDFKSHIHFIVYQENKPPVNTSLLPSRNPVSENLCEAGDLLAVITHGWTWSCAQDWVIDLVSNLTVHRKGCIICMDYSYYASNPDVSGYLYLLSQFNNTRDVLYDQMLEYGEAGLVPENTYMFGFSFGARLVLSAAAMIGYQVIKQIDICDPAGPGFLELDATASAQNVQCLHTSIDKGTLERNCHQDWLMGFCGILQESADPNDPPILGNNHATCPHFYNSAFNNDFLAIPRPPLCFLNVLDILQRREADYPLGFKMGYMQENKEEVQGLLYAETSKYPPYN